MEELQFNTDQQNDFLKLSESKYYYLNSVVSCLKNHRGVHAEKPVCQTSGIRLQMEQKIKTDD